VSLIVKSPEHRTHVGLVPLPEGSGIDFDNGALDQGLGSEQLVVGGVVDLSYPKPG
jgi:hypothetical protein